MYADHDQNHFIPSAMPMMMWLNSQAFFLLFAYWKW